MDTPAADLKHAAEIQVCGLGAEGGAWKIPSGDEVVDSGLVVFRAMAATVIEHTCRTVEDQQGI